MARIGLIGCGNIAGKAYVPGCAHYDNLELVASADINVTVAHDFAKKHDSMAWKVDALLQRDDMDCILNLTTPQWHASINRDILLAGKHVYLEKPFSQLKRACQFWN